MELSNVSPKIYFCRLVGLVLLCPRLSDVALLKLWPTHGRLTEIASCTTPEPTKRNKIINVMLCICFNTWHCGVCAGGVYHAQSAPQERGSVHRRLHTEAQSVHRSGVHARGVGVRLHATGAWFVCPGQLIIIIRDVRMMLS